MAAFLASSPLLTSGPGPYISQATRKPTLSLPLSRSSRSFSPPHTKIPVTLKPGIPQLTYTHCILPESEAGISISLVRDQRTRVEYVVKSSSRSLQEEYEIQSSLAGPHITKTHGYYYDGRYHIIMEYCQRLDLFTYLEDKDLTENEARRLFRQLVAAIETCHMASVVHLDIKPENCFIDAHGILKLGDFGFAKEMKEGHLVHAYCGTLQYMSPEVHLKKPFEGTKADIFAAGKVLFEMALGFTPFKLATLEDPNFSMFIKHPDYYWQKKRTYVADRGGKCEWNVQLLDLLQWMMSFRPASRPTILEVKRHPWLCQGETLTD